MHVKMEIMGQKRYIKDFKMTYLIIIINAIEPKMVQVCANRACVSRVDTSDWRVDGREKAEA